MLQLEIIERSHSTGLAQLSIARGFYAAMSKTMQNLLATFPYKLEFGRGTYWLGDEGLNYVYAGRDHIATGWRPAVLQLRDELLQKLAYSYKGQLFNHLLVNKYLPGQKLNPHRDNEPELLGPIASISFGDSAIFTYGKKQITLHDGDLLLSSRTFNNSTTHGARPPINAGTRYNLTFRTVN